jgi:hypothetical protein
MQGIPWQKSGREDLNLRLHGPDETSSGATFSDARPRRTAREQGRRRQASQPGTLAGEPILRISLVESVESPAGITSLLCHWGRLHIGFLAHATTMSSVIVVRPLRSK